MCVQGYKSKAQEYVILSLDTRGYSCSQYQKSWAGVFSVFSSEGEGGSGDRIFATEVRCKVEANSDCRISQHGKDNLHSVLPQKPFDKLFTFCVIQGKSVTADSLGHGLQRVLIEATRKCFLLFQPKEVAIKLCYQLNVCVLPKLIC